MDKVVERATGMIDQLLENKNKSELKIHISKWYATKNFYDQTSQLINTRNLLNQLLEPSTPKDDNTRLFCRQLQRLMDYNEFLFKEFWIELHEDILCVLQKQGRWQVNDNQWTRFLKKMEFERRLEQHELHFQQVQEKVDSFNELFCKYEIVLKDYLHKCMSLHSKVQVRGLVQELDDFLRRVYGVKEVLDTSEREKRIKEKLKCIEIDLDCSSRSLLYYTTGFLQHHGSGKRADDSVGSFLPSLELTEVKRTYAGATIGDALRTQRWFVMLGDPGSGKTTVLRWITLILATAAHSTQEDVVLTENGSIPVRIPILIRIGEFVEWLNQHPTKTLIDYIGVHTWFAERYCDDNGGNVLRQLIYHGHALILIDGLDEIPEIGCKGEIVDYVKKFIDEYVRAPDFISAFDNRVVDTNLLMFYTTVETQPPSKSGGNQIIVTSRTVGYQFYPLTGPFIQYYSLSLINHMQAEQFVKQWMSQVEKNVVDILMNEGIEIDGETVQTSAVRRWNAIKEMFQISSQLLVSSPSLLSLVCTFIFQEAPDSSPKSRIEVYHCAVQAALHTWKNQDSKMPEVVITDFLIDLAIYLHLNSPSGLIDEFDVEQLCYISLKKQNPSNDRAKLRENVNKLLSFLESNIGIVAQRGLQIYGMLHLSFQEYFVAQALVKGTSVDDVGKRILSYIFDPRFHQSILLAVGWISCKWSMHDYNEFCKFLLISTADCAIPLGTLLFFDAFGDLSRLPSDTVIFTALNSLIDSPSSFITCTYLIPSLSKMPNNIVQEWIQSNLNDAKRLLKFGLSIRDECSKNVDKSRIARNTISTAVCQHLWSLHSWETSIEFFIDRLLRIITNSEKRYDIIFNQELSLYLETNSVCVSSIHPSMLSVIFVVCGGICVESQNDSLDIHFSPKQMHRESPITGSLLEYFLNNEESHSSKVHALIRQYENALQKSLPSDISLRTVDTFIALICLQGVSQLLVYEKYQNYQALPLALDRLKHVWFYLKKSFDLQGSYLHMNANVSFLKSEVESIINMFCSQPDRSDEQRMSFSGACAAAWKKFKIVNMIETLDSDSDTPNYSQINCYRTDQSRFAHFISREELKRISPNTHSLNIFQQNLSFLFTFLPQSLQRLYYCTTISPTNDADSLPVVVFLSECLTHLENIDEDDLNSCRALPTLYPLFKQYSLENCLVVLYCQTRLHCNFEREDRSKFSEVILDRGFLSPFISEEHEPVPYQALVDMERQRLSELTNEVQNQERDVRLFAASLSLARMLHFAHRFSYGDETKKITTFPNYQSVQVYSAVLEIGDPVLRIIALSTILNMKDPSVFGEEQRNDLRCEMIGLLYMLLPDLTLLQSTLLFVRCRASRPLFPEPFQQMADIIGEKLIETITDKQNQDQEVAYVALRQLNNSDLSPYLFNFAKQINNSSDLLHFNSTIFQQYFINTTSFHSSNTALLASMYLVELAFDSQILRMYGEDKKTIFCTNELKYLFEESSKEETIMSFKVASWMTKYLEMDDKSELQLVINKVTSCMIIEGEALSEIEKWLPYRCNNDLRIFAHYAALQLVITGSRIDQLIVIICEMFLIDHEFRLKPLVERLFTSQLVDLTVLRQILIKLHQNARLYSQVSVRIFRLEIFELILNMESERIKSNASRPLEASTNSFLSLVTMYSKDLQSYLAEHLRTCIEEMNVLDNTATEEYITLVLRWVIKNYFRFPLKVFFAVELWEYVLTLLQNRQIPQIQKVIINVLNSTFIDSAFDFVDISLLDDVIINLEIIICSWESHREDIVAICLLAYCNGLLGMQQYQMDRNFSDKVKEILSVLSTMLSLSKIIRVRATFCMILVANLHINLDTISRWFENESAGTPEQIYWILLQQTMCKTDELSLIESKETIINHVTTHWTELADIFVTDLYNYICRQDNNSYQSDLSPNYAQIALQIARYNLDEFCNAIKKSSFGEKEFKRRLHLYCMENSDDSATSINLYAIFGILTDELIEMLKWIDDDKYDKLFESSHRLKQVSDRNVIENFCQLLYMSRYNNKFIILLNMLTSLVESHIISIRQVYDSVLLLSKIPDADGSHEWKSHEHRIVSSLLRLSCFHQEQWSISPETLLTSDDIDEAFEREIEDLDKKTQLLR